MASEPPRLLDIPHHISFLKIYGGGAGRQVYLDKLFEYINVAMPTGRIVSGSFLGKLAALKFRPAEMIPLTVLGCVMAQAVLPKDRENVGMSVTEGNVRSLMTDKKEVGKKVNDILQKALDLMELRQNIEPRMFGDLAVELVKFIFSLDSSFNSIDEIIAGKFAEIFVGGNDPSAAASPGNSSQPANSDDGPQVDYVTYAIDGSSNAGLLTAKSHGFQAGKVVELKSQDIHNKKHTAHLEIDYVNDDGSAGLYPVDQNGATQKTALTVVQLDDLVNNYKLAKSRIQLLANYPSTSASACKE